MKRSDLDELFSEVLTSHRSYIRTVIFNKCGASPCDVDEIVQNTQLDLWKKRGLFEFVGGKVDAKAFKRWAATFAHNHVVWYFSRKKRKDEKIDFDSEKFDVVSEVIGCTDTSFEASSGHESLQHLFYKYNSVLNPHEQNVFKLMWKGMGTYEIAQILDVTHQRISQMTEKIRTKINRHFQSSSEEVVNEHTYKLPHYLNTVKTFLDTGPSNTVHTIKR